MRAVEVTAPYIGVAEINRAYGFLGLNLENPFAMIKQISIMEQAWIYMYWEAVLLTQNGESVADITDITLDKRTSTWCGIATIESVDEE